MLKLLGADHCASHIQEGSLCQKGLHLSLKDMPKTYHEIFSQGAFQNSSVASPRSLTLEKVEVFL